MTKASQFFDKIKHPDWKDTTYREMLCLWTLAAICVTTLLPKENGITGGLYLSSVITHGLWMYDYFIAKQL